MKGMMLNKLIVLASLLFLSSDLLAQQTQAGEAKLQYKNESSFSPLIHSAGVGFNYRRGKHLTGYSRKIWEFDFVTVKHPKEVKVHNSFIENSKGFVYGKLNSVGFIRSGIGVQKAIFTKENIGAVEIRTAFYVGPTIAMLKPVYLEIMKGPARGPELPTVTERYDPTKHDISVITGKAPFARGVGETSFIPGGYAKFALSVEHAPEDDLIRAIETGITVDAFPKKISIMHQQKSTPFFVNFYVALTYGRKWF